MKSCVYLVVFILSLLSVTACSTSESRRQASGDFEYLDIQTGVTLRIPENLDEPDSSQTFSIPSLADSSPGYVVGSQVDISSPRLVIPLVSGSYIEEGGKNATVIFDQINDNENLDRTLWDKVLTFLEANEIGVDSFDQDKNILVTDWVIEKREVDSAWYDLIDNTIEEAKKFKLSMELAPHGRTAKLTNELVEFIDESGNSVLADKRISKVNREDEVNFLNLIIAEYDFEIRLEQTKRIARIREGFSSTMDFNSVGDPALIVNAEYQNTWPRLQLVLREMGFVIVDFDQSAGLIFANYIGDTSWFSDWFGGNDLEIEEGEYRLLVEPADAGTIVTFKESDNSTFTADQLVSLYPYFSKIMADDGLNF